MRAQLAAAIVLAATSIAAANSGVIATDEPRRAPSSWFDGRIAMMLGAADVGDTGGFSMGLATGAGYRVGDVTLRATFDFYRVGDSESASSTMPPLSVRRGRALRLGGAARYALVGTRRDSGALAELWGELGGGLEHVEWRGGGVVDRPSGAIAFGVDLGARYDRDRRRRSGGFLAIRTLIAQPPPSDTMPTCGGPCDRATRPGVDFSTFFEMGFHWGR